MGNLISSSPSSMVNTIRQVLNRLLKTIRGDNKQEARYKYPTMTKALGDFKLRVTGGEFTKSQIILIQGVKGTGKTTFMRMLAGLLRPDSVEFKMPEFTVSYKPQKISPMSEEGSVTVRDLLDQRIPDAYIDHQFVWDVMQPLLIEELMDQQVANLSDGELQRLELCLCLGKPADIYLIDEPGAYLDPEERMVATEVIRRFIRHAKKTAFVAESNFMMAFDLFDDLDRAIPFHGKPSIGFIADSPQPCLFNVNAIAELYGEIDSS